MFKVGDRVRFLGKWYTVFSRNYAFDESRWYQLVSPAMHPGEYMNVTEQHLAAQQP